MALRCGVLLSLAVAALGEPAAPYQHYHTSVWADPDTKTGTPAGGDASTNEWRGSAAAISHSWTNRAAREHALRRTYMNVPELTILGSKMMHVELSHDDGERFNDPGAKCIDFDPNGKHETKGTLHVAGRVNLQKVGEYQLLYDCRSSIHPHYSSATAMRTVIVGPPKDADAVGHCGVGMRAEHVDNGGGSTKVVCRYCAPGRYSDRTSAGRSCKQCEQGRYQLLAGQNTCKPNMCEEGKYLDLGTGACKPCAPNTYSSGGALGGCTPCGHNSMGEALYRFERGGRFARSCAVSKCVPGTFQRQGRCDPCPVNTYQPFFGQLHCIDCPAGMRTKTKSGNVKCVNKNQALTAAEVEQKYLRPRKCSDITCSIRKGMVFTGTQYRHAKLDRRFDYSKIGHRIVVHHGPEFGKYVPNGRVLNEIHGMHHRCAMYNNYQDCTCLCWYTPEGYDQWKAVRATTEKGGLHYERVQAQRKEFWKEFKKTGYVHLTDRETGGRRIWHYAAGGGTGKSVKFASPEFSRHSYDPAKHDADWITDEARFKAAKTAGAV